MLDKKLGSFSYTWSLWHKDRSSGKFFFSQCVVYSVAYFTPVHLCHSVDKWGSPWLVFLHTLSIMKQWQGMVYPLLLTSLIYAGSLVLKLLLLLESWKENGGGGCSCNDIKRFFQSTLAWLLTGASNISVWRNFIVVIICSLSHLSYLSILYRNCIRHGFALFWRLYASVWFIHGDTLIPTFFFFSLCKLLLKSNNNVLLKLVFSCDFRHQ